MVNREWKYFCMIEYWFSKRITGTQTRNRGHSITTNEILRLFMSNWNDRLSWKTWLGLEPTTFQTVTTAIARPLLINSRACKRHNIMSYATDLNTDRPITINLWGIVIAPLVLTFRVTTRLVTNLWRHQRAWRQTHAGKNSIDLRNWNQDHAAISLQKTSR